MTELGIDVDTAAAPTMRQVAPYPVVLVKLVDRLRYKPGWTFDLDDIDRGQGSEGLTLDITTLTANSYHPSECKTCHSVVTDYRVHHYFIVPAAAYDMRSWRRWLLDRIIDVETHEACEFLRFEWDTPNRIGTEILGFNHHVERPYSPSHGPGSDPYLIREVGTNLDQKTSFRGTVNA